MNLATIRDIQTCTRDCYRKRKHASASSWCTLSRCPRKFFYDKGLGLSLPSRSRVALDYGSAMHYALPLAYTSPGKAIEAFESAFGLDRSEDTLRTRSTAKVSLLGFHRDHLQTWYSLETPPSSIKADAAETVSEIELPFAIDIGMPYLLVGRLDAVARNRVGGELWGIEFKTSREVSDRFFNGFALSPQILTYALALHALYEPELPAGIVIEAIRTSNAKVESVSYAQSVSEEQIESIIEWYKAQAVKLTIFEALYFENGEEFPQNFALCNPYASFGLPGYNCDYIELCSVGDYRPLLGLYEVTEERPFLIGEKE